MPYEPKLADGVSLPEGHRIDVGDERYKALEALATRERWSQAAFSDVLSIESRRVSAEHERARAAPPAAAASAPDAKPDFSKMSTREKFQWALDNPRRG
jgi:hypothetical protein